MSTEITQFHANAAVSDPAAQRPSALPAQASALVEWAHSADAALHLAQGLCSTPFCPQAYRDKPYDGAAAILAGAEVGLSPMGALRSFDVIQGQAAPRAMTLRAIVQSHGHEIWVEEQTSSRAIVAGRRKGSTVVERSEWTIDRAKGLQLTGKDNWKKQPGAMLVARATAECARLIAADAILGIPYTVEELTDGQDDPEPQETPKRTAKRTTRKATAQRAEPSATTKRAAARTQPEPEQPALDGPPLPGEDADEAAPEPEAEPADEAAPATRSQLNKLHAQLGELGIDEKADKLTTVGLLARRTLASSAELTKDQASQVIDTLDRVCGSDDPTSALDAVLAEVQEAMDAEGGES